MAKNSYTFIMKFVDKPVEQMPIDIQEMLYEYALGNVTVRSLQIKANISRAKLDDFLTHPNIVKHVLGIRKKASEQISERLNKLQIKALDAYEDVLAVSKNESTKIRAARDLLSGLGIFKDSSEVAAKVVIEIAPELKKE